MLIGQTLESRLQIYEGKVRFLSPIDRKCRMVLRERRRYRPSPFLAYLAYERVTHNNKKPGAQIGSLLPGVNLLDGACQGFLNQIVGAVRITNEIARVAP